MGERQNQTQDPLRSNRAMIAVERCSLRSTPILCTKIYRRSAEMNMSFALVSPPLISLLAGISILIWPRLLSYIVAFYLILFGLVGLLPLML